MPTINVSSFNAISNINTCLQNYCIPAQTAAIQSGWCACGRAAGNTAGNADGYVIGTCCANTAIRPCYDNVFVSYSAAIAGVANLYSNTYVQQYYSKRASCDLSINPWCCCTWAAIPTLETVTGGSCVRDTTYWTQGVCCAYTVPAGATYLRFQIWGAGAGSHNQCCCGVSMWGGSGAYASVIIPAVPGCVYTLCAGCAYVCSMREAGIDTGHGCASFVVGYGLCNFCADGGDSNQYNWQMRVKNCDSTYAGYCVGMYISDGWTRICKGTVYGCCICSGGGACFGGTCNFTQYPFSTSCKNYYGCVTNGNNACHFVIGTPGVFNKVFDTSYGYYGCLCLTWSHPPITCYSTCCCDMVINMQECCPAGLQYHACSSSTYGCWPGMGGRPSAICGGYNNCGGGIGSGGMVCVQYTTTT